MSSLSIFDAAREQPRALALVDGNEELSFAEVAHRTEPLVAALRRAAPDVLALTPRADTASLLWLYAAFASGTPVLTHHARASEPERQQALALTSASFPTVCDASALDTKAARPRSDAAVFDSNATLSQQADSPRVDPRRPLALIPTSGSTGQPRLVELSRAAIEASAHASAANLGWQSDDLWLLCLPLAHTGGLSIVTRALLGRKPISLFEPGPAGALKQLPRLASLLSRATLVSLVPSLLQALLDAGFSPPPRLRAVLLGGAACAPALARRAHAARIPLLTSYGLTETASQVVTRRYAERFEPLPERDGRVSSGHPLPGVELELRHGAIAVRTPSLLSRYLGDPAAVTDEQGWLVTRDCGQFGAQGELYVRGRLDDVIVTAAENVDPLEVEAALLALPGIDGACVVGTASERFGQIVSAVLVTRDAALGKPPALAERLAPHLAPHKLPRRVLVTSSLPLTASGKVDRKACARLLTAAHADKTL